MCRFLCLMSSWMTLVLAAASSLGAGIAAANLRCEYHSNPLAIDALRPRLSWVLTDDPTRRGEAQSAYQVLVARSLDALGQDRGDLWDSGKVASDQSTQIVYAGKPLGSRQRCYWKVRVWDQDGKACGWSDTAEWSDGTAASRRLEGAMDRRPCGHGAGGATRFPARHLPSQTFQLKAAPKRATGLCHGGGPVRAAPERPAGGPRLLHARLDRVRQTGLLPGLRRDRAAAQRGQRDRGHPRRRLVRPAPPRPEQAGAVGPVARAV